MKCVYTWVAPKKNVAFLICAKQSGDEAFGATNKVMVTVMDTHNQPCG